MVAPETPRAPEAARPLDASRWGVLALLFASITINLLDRQVLSVMAPLIRDELQISNAQYSYIVFCFLL
ncbi:MAG: MFS transporter, partial [Acidobacteriota bacterium]